MTGIVGLVCATAVPNAMPATMPAAIINLFMIILRFLRPGGSLNWVCNRLVGACIGAPFENSIRTVAAERVLLGGRCRVINAPNPQLGSHEGPSKGDTAAVPPTQGVFSRNLKNQCAGDPTSV